MPEIRLKIKGVHYAVHSDYNPKNGDVSTEEMEQKTTSFLNLVKDSYFENAFSPSVRIKSKLALLV